MVWLGKQQTISRVDIAWMADVGVNSVLTYGNRLAELVPRCHEFGVKVIALWPDWFELGMTTPPYAFREYRGRMCYEDVPVSEGPSYWHPSADDYAAVALTQLKAAGADGLLICPRAGDKPFPKEWYHADEDAFRYNALFWSFDEWATAAWSKTGQGEMPTHAVVKSSGELGFSREFYRWYQSAWANRIYRLSDFALNDGFRELYTWYIPCHAKTAENMAMGSWDHTWVYDGWVQRVRKGSGTPTMVAACCLGSWLAERATNIQITTELVCERKWPMMVGMEVSGASEKLLPNLIVNGKYAVDRGMGLFVSGKFFFEETYREAVGIWLRSLQMR